MKTLAGLVLATTLSLTGCQLVDRIRMNEVGIGTGQAYGKTRIGAHKVTPAHFRIGTDVNHFFGVTNDYGKLQLATEILCNPISKPKKGIETGICTILRYTPPLETMFRPYIEGGSGPIHLSADIPDQGKGFNFLIQVGGGVQYFLDDDFSLSLGYRYRHISHAGTRDAPNHGLDTNAIIFGISKHF